MCPLPTRFDSVMINAENWKKDEFLLSFLGNELRHGHLALVLGAGVSVPFGLPNWETLIKRLEIETGVTAPIGWDLKRKVEHIRKKKHGHNMEAFLTDVHTALYKGVKVTPWALRTNGLLGAMGALIMNSRRGRIQKIITFNYDDILESYLEYHGFVTRSIHNEKYWEPGADVVVYHPHGSLPSSPARTRSDEIVLDQLSYSKVIGSSELWWHEMRQIFRHHFCLFVGLSGFDDNLDAMLAFAHENHPANDEQLPYWGVSFSEPKDDVVELWEMRGIFCKVVKDYHRSLPEFLYRICQVASRTSS